MHPSSPCTVLTEIGLQPDRRLATSDLEVWHSKWYGSLMAWSMKPLRLLFAALTLASHLSAQKGERCFSEIRFADGTNQVPCGEIIAVELSFKASISDIYDTQMRNYDRSGGQRYSDIAT